MLPTDLITCDIFFSNRLNSSNTDGSSWKTIPVKEIKGGRDMGVNKKSNHREETAMN